jgi:hypothetical protein
MIGRRALLIGGGGLGLALAGLGYRAWDRGVGTEGEGEAYEPWRTWEGRPQDGRRRPLRAAILAANPHDTQPWAFAVRPEAIDVFADRSRNLGSFDPFRREMHLGLGAAIENLTLTARACGLSAAVEPAAGALTLKPDDAPIRAARIVLEPGPEARDELFAAIPRRHTNRGPYRPNQPVAPEELRRLADLAASGNVRVAFVAEEGARRDLGALIVEATGRIVDDAEMSADSARWFRTGRREVAAHRDGVTLDAAGLSPQMTALAKLLPDIGAKTSDAYWLAMTRDVQVPTGARNRVRARSAGHARGHRGRAGLAAAASRGDRLRIGGSAAQPAGRARRPRQSARAIRRFWPRARQIRCRAQVGGDLRLPPRRRRTRRPAEPAAGAGGGGEGVTGAFFGGGIPAAGKFSFFGP